MSDAHAVSDTRGVCPTHTRCRTHTRRRTHTRAREQRGVQQGRQTAGGKGEEGGGESPEIDLALESHRPPRRPQAGPRPPLQAARTAEWRCPLHRPPRPRRVGWPAAAAPPPGARSRLRARFCLHVRLRAQPRAQPRGARARSAPPRRARQPGRGPLGEGLCAFARGARGPPAFGGLWGGGATLPRSRKVIEPPTRGGKRKSENEARTGGAVPPVLPIVPPPTLPPVLTGHASSLLPY